MKASVKAISYYLPENTLTNKELCTLFPNLAEADIFKKTGIKKRHLIGPGLTGTELAYQAAYKLFLEHSIDKNLIDYIIYCSSAMDSKGPAGACTLQNRLELPSKSGAIDIALGCTGYTYCLSLAKGLIESNQATNILILTSDVPSRVIHPNDAELRMIFGDAGAATIVSATSNTTQNIGNFTFGTDGNGECNLTIKRSGIKNPIDSVWLKEHENAGGMKDGKMEMNSIEIFTFALRIVPPMIDEILLKNNLEKSEIDLFIFHQANGFLLSVLRRKLQIEEEKFFTFMEEVGNTVSASIPIALYEAIKIGKAKKGNKILLASFGIGYSWSGTVITL